MICKQTLGPAHAKIKKIAWFPRNGARKVAFDLRSREDRQHRNSTSVMAASPGNMYQKKALKTRHTTGLLQPSSGSMSKADRYLKADKDIPMNAQPPPSPTIDPSANMRKFSQITLRSDTSDDLHTDLNSNGAAVGTPKQTRAKRHLHQVRYGFLQTAQMLSNFPCEVL